MRHTMDPSRWMLKTAKIIPKLFQQDLTLILGNNFFQIWFHGISFQQELHMLKLLTVRLIYGQQLYMRGALGFYGFGQF